MTQFDGDGDGDGLPDLGSLKYEELVGLLEHLTRQMSSGQVGIEEAASLYEQAGLVHHAAAERLAGVTARLAVIAAEEVARPGTAPGTAPEMASVISPGRRDPQD